MKRVASYCFLFSVLVTGTGCRDSISTSPTNVAPSTVTMSGSATSAAAPDLEGFTCENLEEVHVRFSDPGFVRGNEVAVYAAFLGAPPGDKFLRIYWDHANKPAEFQIVDTPYCAKTQLTSECRACAGSQLEREPGEDRQRELIVELYPLDRKLRSLALGTVASVAGVSMLVDARVSGRTVPVTRQRRSGSKTLYTSTVMACLRNTMDSSMW